MGKGLLRYRGVIIGSMAIVLLMIGGVVAVDVQPDLSSIEKGAQPMSILNNLEWHAGNNQSTPLVDCKLLRRVFHDLERDPRLSFPENDIIVQ